MIPSLCLFVFCRFAEMRSWKKVEENEFDRKIRKTQVFDQTLPKKREIEYAKKRKLIRKDQLFIEKERKMVLINHNCLRNSNYCTQ